MNKTFTDLLSEYLALRSVSTDPAYASEMGRTAQWLGAYLGKHGFDVSYLSAGKSNPVVVARYVQSPDLETMLVYGHYDVQPADVSDGWASDPFVLTERKGRLYARGVVDNKGQNLIHVFTVCELIREGRLGYNVTFMIEGDEETGGPDMPLIVKKHRKLLAADAVIVSDGEIMGTTPTIEAGLRGGFNMKVAVTTGKNNLHSGLAGGVAPSAAHELSRLIARFYDKDNQVAIPGFYRGVRPLTRDQLAHTRVTGTNDGMKKLFGVKGIVSEKGMNPSAQIGLRPTIQVSGIRSGYTGEGYSNIIPAMAEARINVRIVGGQDPKKVYESVAAFIRRSLPAYADVRIEHTDFATAVSVDVAKPRFVAVRALLERAFGKKPVIKYVGGSIPVVTDFKETLGMDALLVSLGNDDCNMHGVDENFRTDLVKKGLAFSRMFFERRD